MSYITDLTAILEALPEDATAEEVYTATREYSRREVAAAMYALNAAGGGGGDSLPLTGGTLTGALVVNANATVNGSLAANNAPANGSWFEITADEVSLTSQANNLELNCGSSQSIYLAAASGNLIEAGDFSGTRKIGFFGGVPAAKPTGVAVTAAAIHAALVNLGLIAGP